MLHPIPGSKAGHLPTTSPNAIISGESPFRFVKTFVDETRRIRLIATDGFRMAIDQVQDAVEVDPCRLEGASRRA